MINNDKWINSLPNANLKYNQESVQIDNNKWVNTIPKINKSIGILFPAKKIAKK